MSKKLMNFTLSSSENSGVFAEGSDTETCDIYLRDLQEDGVSFWFKLLDRITIGLGVSNFIIQYKT